MPPWIDRRYHLVDWWAMLEFSGKGFFRLSRWLENIVLDCYMGSVPVDQHLFVLQSNIDDFSRKKATEMVMLAAAQFSHLGMPIAAETAEELKRDLEQSGIGQNYQWLMEKTKELRSLAEKEMKNTFFFYIPKEKAQFLPLTKTPNLFGDEVANAFPSAAQDIRESGMCLALARGSASVFHAMRVLEFGLSALGKIFDVSLAHTNWQPAITEIERKIRGMHSDSAWRQREDCKQKQETYSQMASHFSVLKDAWRNYTMHARGVYTEEMAESIFRNVKDFMRKLVAGGLHE